MERIRPRCRHLDDCGSEAEGHALRFASQWWTDEIADNPTEPASSGDRTRYTESRGLVFRGERGGALVNWDRWLKRIFAKSGTRSWSAHALRRTAATIAGETGTPPHIVQVMLGHRNIGGQLHAGYNQSRYSNEHATALQLLADHIDNIVISSRHVDGGQA